MRRQHLKRKRELASLRLDGRGNQQHLAATDICALKEDGEVAAESSRVGDRDGTRHDTPQQRNAAASKPAKKLQAMNPNDLLNIAAEAQAARKSGVQEEGRKTRGKNRGLQNFRCGIWTRANNLRISRRTWMCYPWRKLFACNLSVQMHAWFNS